MRFLKRKICPSCEKRFRTTSRMMIHIFRTHMMELQGRIYAATKAFMEWKP